MRILQEGNSNLFSYVRFCRTPPVDGVYAEYAVMPMENCFSVPESLGSAEAAMLEPLGIAIHGVDLGQLKPGCTVAVLGAGPIGLLTAAVARASGARDALMTEPLAYRREFALEYVADAISNPEQSDVVAEVSCASPQAEGLRWPSRPPERRTHLRKRLR